MRRSTSASTLFVVAAAGIALAVPAAAAPPPSSGPTGSVAAQTLLDAGQLAPRTAAQIEALARVKAGLSPTERKVDSRLLAAEWSRQRRPLAAGVPSVDPGVRLGADGRAPVTVDGAVTATLLGQVRALGGTVRDSHPGSLLADVPVTAVTALAALPGVTHVGQDLGYATANEIRRPGPASDPTSEQAKAARAQVLRDELQKALQHKASASAVTQGSVVSEGDRTHGADVARAQRHVSGAGVTVGVLSDGVDSLDAAIASGDLPASTRVLPDQEGSGDEGTAMMEIVHDLAPTADLVFATADPTADQFAQNIRDLRAAGADIIVDDVTYFAESPFQDGPIAQAVIDVTKDGALYFSSAGNEQNVDDHTSGSYEGDYRSSGQTIGKFAGTAHDFDPGSAVQVLDPVSDDSVDVPALLQWADPLGRSADDYDLYAVDGAGDVIAFSNDTQNGDDDPFEGFFIPEGTVGLAVVKFAGANRYFQLTAFRGRYESRPGMTAFVSPGVTRGHSAVPAAFSVAAVPAAEAFGREIAPGVVNPTGPYPLRYKASQQSEVFTSDGPRRVFFRPNGSAITPGDFTSSGGEVRRKPDVAAADGVSTSLSDFTPFFGTSASAPHAAAIAALVLSGHPGITPARVRRAMTSTALDIEHRGWDRDTGYGIVVADTLLARTGAQAQPLVRAGDPVVTPRGDGDAFLEPGETADVAVPVTNVGDAAATQVAVRLTSSTPGVTIAPASVSVGAVGAGATVTAPVIHLTLASTYDPGVPVQLQERVTFHGAFSPQTGDHPVPTGQPSGTVLDVRYTGPAVPIPDDDPAGASVTFTVSGVGRVADLSLSIDGTACTTDDGATTVGIDHTFDGDLVATLTAPDGRQVLLLDHDGSSSNNFCQTLLTDTATQSIEDGFGPFTGSFRPEQPLSTFVSGVANGTWTFTAVDTAALDTGSLRALTLHLRPYLTTS
jgi:subtilisin-like proprotein convertase family protein